MPKKLNIFILLLSLVVSISCKGQRFIEVLDEEKEPLRHAYAEVHWANGTVETLTCDDKGKIALANAGRIVVKVRCYGYVAIDDTIQASVNSRTFTLKVLPFYKRRITVTGGGKKEDDVESVHKVKVIKSQYLKETGKVDLKDALQNETNIQLGQDNVLGSSLSLQGISGQGVKILIDGVPIIGRLNGNIDLSQIDITNVDRIEIIEGPMSVLYGADALGGVINIITKVPKDGQSSFKMGTYNDNFEHHNITGSLQNSLSKKVKIGFSGGRKFFRGFDFNDSTRSQDWKPKTELFGDANVFLKFKKHNHRFRTRVFADKLTVLSDANNEIYTITGFNTYYFTTRSDFEQFSIFDLKNKGKIRIQNSYNVYRREKEEYRRDLVNGIETLMPKEFLDTTVFDQWQTRAYYFTNNKKKANFMLGTEMTLFSGTGTKIEDRTQRTNEVALFGSAVVKLGKLKLNPGIRMMHQSQFGKEIGSSGVKLAPFIPTLHAKYTINPKNNLKFSIAKGYRAPSLKELHFYFVDRNHNILGNYDLQPEQSFHADVFWEARKTVKKNKMISSSFGVFYNDIIEKVQLIALGGNNEYSYSNIGNIKTVGIQGGVRFRSKRWTVNTNLSGNGLSSDSSNGYKWNPQFVTTLKYTLLKSKWNLNFSHKWNGKSYGFNDDLNLYQIDPYAMTDVSASKSFLKRKLFVSAGIRNLLNVTNVQSSGTSSGGHSSDLGNIPMSLGRTYFLNLTFALNYVKSPKNSSSSEKK